MEKTILKNQIKIILVLLIFILATYFRCGKANWLGGYPTYNFYELLFNTIFGITCGFIILGLRSTFPLKIKSLKIKFLAICIIFAIIYIIYNTVMFFYDCGIPLWASCIQACLDSFPNTALFSLYLGIGYLLFKFYNQKYWFPIFIVISIVFYIITTYYLDYLYFWDIWLGISKISSKGNMVIYHNSFIAIIQRIIAGEPFLL